MTESGRESRGLYYLDSFPLGNSFEKPNLAKCCVSKHKLHCRLGHLADKP